MADNEAPKPTPTKPLTTSHDWRDSAREQQMRLEALTLAERTLSSSRSGLDRDPSGDDVLKVARSFHEFITEGSATKAASAAPKAYATGGAIPGPGPGSVQISGISAELSPSAEHLIDRELGRASRFDI